MPRVRAKLSTSIFFRSAMKGYTTDDKKSGTEVDLKPGQAVYMKVEVVSGFWKGGGRLLQVAPEQGAFESKRLELVPAREVEDPRFR